MINCTNNDEENFYPWHLKAVKCIAPVISFVQGFIVQDYGVKNRASGHLYEIQVFFRKFDLQFSCEILTFLLHPSFCGVNKA